MIQVAILKRRLKDGKTYDDFRRAWYHTVGFGSGNRMLTAINVANPREIIVIGLTETSIDQLRQLIAIDAAERSANPLDDVIEPEIDRTFGILVAEDDFSSEGALEYVPPRIDGVETEMAAVDESLAAGQRVLRELYGA